MAKPAKQSRTLRFNRFVTAAASAWALLPSAVTFLLDLVGDPALAGAVADFLPNAKVRAVVALLLVAVAQRNRALRHQTTEPIEEPAR